MAQMFCWMGDVKIKKGGSSRLEPVVLKTNSVIAPCARELDKHVNKTFPGWEFVTYSNFVGVPIV